MKQLNYLFIILLIVVIVVFGSRLNINEGTKAEISDASIALNSILGQNPQKSMAHDEHSGLVLSNGDVVEFSRDASISGDDVVIAINVAALEPGVINFENVPFCPPLDEEIENEKFCYKTGEVLAKEEPHLAKVYPKGLLLRTYNTN